MKRKNPETSILAYKMLTPEMIAGHHGKIIAALQKLGTASYEQLSDYTGLEKHKIGRRLSELERMEVVYKPGSKSPTKSGRMAMNYCLVGTGAKTEAELNTYKKGEKSSTDYSRDLLKATQTNLFP